MPPLIVFASVLDKNFHFSSESLFLKILIVNIIIKITNINFGTLKHCCPVGTRVHDEKRTIIIMTTMEMATLTVKLMMVMMMTMMMTMMTVMMMMMMKETLLFCYR